MPDAPGPIAQALIGAPWKQAHRLLPGLLLAAGVVAVAHVLAVHGGAWIVRAQGLDPAKVASPLSTVTVAILLGLAMANTSGTPALFAPGLKFGTAKLLRLGIILVGIKLTFVEVLRLGAWGVPVVAAVVGGALVLTIFIARRLGLSDRMAYLAAASTSICGVTATLAVAPQLDAEDREVAYTVANVTLFGLAAMLAYPYLAHALFAASPASAGLFLGTSIHDTSQVVGAAMNYRALYDQPRAFEVATVAKLTRNCALVAVIPILAALWARRAGGPGKSVGWARLFPLFVLGFLAMALLRSAGDAAGWGAAWKSAVRLVGDDAAPFALAGAMASVGLSTRFASFKGLGWRPVLAGAAAALIVGGLGLGLAALAGPRIG